MNYIDPEEEFEMMHADELEMMNEMEFENNAIKICSPKESKRSLNFFSQEQIISQENSRNLSSELNGVFPLSQTSVSFNKDDDNDNEVQQNNTELVNNKRTIDDQDLFGDIDDIEFGDEEFEPVSKRQKVVVDLLSEKETRQQNLINKIIDERQKFKSGKKSNFLSSFSYNSPTNVQPHEYVSRRVPSWSFFPAIDDENQRVYIRFRSEDSVQNELSSLSWHTKSVQLLSDPIDVLIARAYEKIENNESMLSGMNTNGINALENGIDNTAELWVQKYKPNRYLDLLSDESTNRILLRWLKLWDKVVFNKEVIKKRRNTSNSYDKSIGNKFTIKNQLLDEELDEYKCPKYKLALLCGPPGLGKTTLAHLIARQAGYNVVEINASDDRNLTSFKMKLEASTQMSSVISKDSRPNCLVLDEIDGSPVTSIDFLIKFATAKHVDRKKKSSKKDEKVTILKRPIICICNDVYVPALRNLRQCAFVLHFPPTSSIRLAERLMEISSYENIKTDMGAMTALGTKTNNDIRSCLSTLSCFRNQSVRLLNIKNANIGTKDMQKGLFTVWQEIFQIKKSCFENNPCASDGFSSHNNVMKDRINSILKSVQSYGDYEKLSQGVFENFVCLKNKDSSLSNISEGLEWFCYFDQTIKVINSFQNYSLYPYLPYSFATWHCLFATFTWPKITYPSSAYEATIKKNKNKQIMDELMSGIIPSIRTFLHRDQVLLDTMPLLMHIAVPNLRSISIQLFTQKEKEDLAKVVNIMIDYGLNFFQERDTDGSFNFVLNPCIDEAIKFPGLETFPTSNYAIKQIINREIELEKLRKKMPSVNLNNITEDIDQLNENEKNVTTPKSVKGAYNKQVTPNHLQKLIPKAVLNPTKNIKKKDFFGRVVASSTVSVQREIRDEIVKSDVWFHFKEGYSNAVRKLVLMKDLY